MLPQSYAEWITGGAIGYVAYDCIRYFEPKTLRELKDPLGIPESFFMITDAFVVFDHPFQTVNIVSHVFLPNDTSSESIAAEYASAEKKIAALAAKINATEPLPLPVQQPIPKERAEAVSNIGKEGYKAHVRKMRDHIIKGDIIQAVPSQRLARPTALHPFNAYRYADLLPC